MQQESLAATYLEIYKPLYDKYLSRLHTLITELVSQLGIPIFQIESRVKDVDSFTDKVAKKNYQKPFEEIKDFAGIRLITYYNDDVEIISEVLKSEFLVDPIHSSDKADGLDIQEFGYRSLHLVLSLTERRARLREWKPFANLPAEVQIRSILQHAWASISHKIDYKAFTKSSVSDRRKLFRLSALLELSDEEFRSIRDNSNIVRTDPVHFKKTASPLDISALREFIEEHVDLQYWADMGVAAGMIGPYDPHFCRIRATFYGLNLLLSVLQLVGVATIEAFSTLLRKIERLAEYYLREFIVCLDNHDEIFCSNGVDVGCPKRYETFPSFWL